MKLSTLETIFESLNQARVQYLIAGGIAVNIHGYQRMTADLDIVINLNTDNINRAMESLSTLDYLPLIPINSNDFADPLKRKEWIETKNMQVLSLQSPKYPETTIDIFVTEPFDFEKEYENSELAELTDDINFKVVSIPTLIKMKEKSGRVRDLDDIQHLKLILDEKNNE